MIRYIKDLKKHAPFNLGFFFSIIVACVAAIIGYGVNTGLLICCVIFSILSDGLAIVYGRTYIFRRRFAAESIRGVKLYLPVFICLSVILHLITYHYLREASFYHLAPLLALLIIIYGILKFEKRRRGNN